MDNNNWNQQPQDSQWAPGGQGTDPNANQQQGMGADPNMYQQPNMGADPNMYQQPNMGADPNMYQQPYMMGENPGVYGQAPAKKSKTGLIIGILSAAIIALAVGVYFLLFAGGGYKKPMDDIASIVNTRNSSMDDIIDAALPSFAAKPVKSLYSLMGKSSSYRDQLVQAQSQLDDGFESIEDDYGKDFRISYKVKEKTALDSDDCEDISEQYQALYTNYLSIAIASLDMATDEQMDQAAAQLGLSGADFEPLLEDIKALAKELKAAEVSDAYELKVELTAESSEMLEDTVDVEFRMIRINGEWMIDYLGIAEGTGIDLSTFTGLMN